MPQHNAMQFLIVINGLPGSGKSYIGDLLSKTLNFPYFSKDDIKELLFDNLGWKDREWSKKLGSTSFEMLFYILDEHVRSGSSCIVETAFFPAFHTKRFLKIVNRYQLKVIQLYCIADEKTLARRFKTRAESGERHPGHFDHVVTDDHFKSMLRSDKYGKLEIGGSFLTLDTSDFASLDYNFVINDIKDAMRTVEACHRSSNQCRR
ncbi:MAG: ATP-binding protein [Proteobacteria bacterium]|nr:ATP-binding protein [Pseudomonadota bacterium]